MITRNLSRKVNRRQAVVRLENCESRGVLHNPKHFATACDRIASAWAQLQA